jgi:hypothetical protein
MTTLKVDFITFQGASSDVTLELSGIASSGTYATATGLIDPTTNNISTTGIISGIVFKTSGNVTVISDAGTISPYGLYNLASGAPQYRESITYVSGAETVWQTLTDTALSIALGKC